jgi:hypothetical protein
VTLDIKRRLYLRYEPILATVHITNLSGRDLMLYDTEQPWFGFDVTGANNETIIPPRDIAYKLDPIELKIGETVKRTVDLTQLYPISEFGIHRIKATVFARPLNKFFASKPEVVDIAEGKTLWRQTVGVPDTLPNEGRDHLFKLIEFQGDKRYLYVRVEDEDQGTIFCTYRVGHMIDGTTPEMQLDTSNNLYVLHLAGPKAYMLTNIGVNGEFLGQHIYDAPKSRPYLRRLVDGTIQIVGGKRRPAETAGNKGSEGPQPKLSDRPPGLPAN